MQGNLAGFGYDGGAVWFGRYVTARRINDGARPNLRRMPIPVPGPHPKMARALPELRRDAGS